MHIWTHMSLSNVALCCATETLRARASRLRLPISWSQYWVPDSLRRASYVSVFRCAIYTPWPSTPGNVLILDTRIVDILKCTLYDTFRLSEPTPSQCSAWYLYYNAIQQRLVHVAHFHYPYALHHFLYTTFNRARTRCNMMWCIRIGVFWNYLRNTPRHVDRSYTVRAKHTLCIRFSRLISISQDMYPAIRSPYMRGTHPQWQLPCRLKAPTHWI